MLAKKNRLVTDTEIKKALKTKFQKFAKFYSVKISPNEEQQFKLLVIVPKKSIKKANKRNLVKRRIVSIFEELQHKNQLPIGVNLIIHIKSSEIIDLDYIVLKDNILSSVINLYQKYLDKKNNRPKQ